MATGKVDFFNDTGGYGFIETEDGGIAVASSGLQRGEHVVAVDRERTDPCGVGRLRGHIARRCRSRAPPQSGQLARYDRLLTVRAHS